MSFLDRILGRKTAPVDAEKGLAGNVSTASTFGGTFLGASTGGAFLTNSEYHGSLAFRLVDIIAATAASLDPAIVSRNGAALTPGHRANNRALRRPCSLMTAHDLWRLLVHRMYEHGAAYAVVSRDGAARLRELIPIPAPVRMVDREGQIWWQISNAQADDILGPRLRAAGFSEMVADLDMLVLRGPPMATGNGLSCVAPLKNATSSVALETALTEFVADLHRNGGRPSLIMTAPGKISQETSDRARQAFQKVFGRGTGNHAGLMVLPEGTDLKPVSSNAVDAQTQAAREFQILELARRFGIPPTMAGVANAVPRATVEMEMAAFYSNALRPLLEGIEAALEDRIIATEDLTEFGIEFDVSGLLRADTGARGEYILKLRTAGVISPNTARLWEGLAPVEGGDDIRAPLNSNVTDRGRPPSPDQPESP